MIAATRPSQRGLTLVELMVVVAIVGVLVVSAVVLIRTKPDARDTSQQIANVLREASRKAVAGGAVRSEVIDATGIEARTRVHVFEDAGAQIVALERLTEDPPPADTASWVELQRVALGGHVEVHGYRPSAELQPGLGPDTVITGGGEAVVECRPDGSCDPMTLYVQTTDTNQRARVVIMPLNGAPLTFAEW